MFERAEKIRHTSRGDPVPLDTPQVPDETSGDTPGFAHRWARVVVSKSGTCPDFYGFEFFIGNRFFYSLRRRGPVPAACLLLMDFIAFGLKKTPFLPALLPHSETLILPSLPVLPALQKTPPGGHGWPWSGIHRHTSAPAPETLPPGQWTDKAHGDFPPCRSDR